MSLQATDSQDEEGRDHQQNAEVHIKLFKGQNVSSDSQWVYLKGEAGAIWNSTGKWTESGIVCNLHSVTSGDS